MFSKSYVLLGATALLAIVSISIAWQLLTADYPTHSDVFFLGVEAGALGVVLLVCLVLTGFLLYRLMMLPKRTTRIEDTSISPFKQTETTFLIGDIYVSREYGRYHPFSP